MQVAEEELVLRTVVGCMAGMHTALVGQAAVHTAHTRLCLASCSAHMDRARQTALVARGCKWSRWWQCYDTGQWHNVRMVDKLAVQVVVAAVEEQVAGTVDTDCMRLEVAGNALP